MSEPIVPPCGWDTLTGCDKLDTDDPDEALAAKIAVAKAVAVNVIFQLTARRYSACDRTVRPCRNGCGSALLYDPVGPVGPWTPLFLGGQWRNIRCGSCYSNDCGCSSFAELVLPRAALTTIQSVKVDGVELTPGDDYRVYDNARLVRVGGGTWPLCQDLSKPDTEPGTWSITYLDGTPPPPAVLFAAGRLACELLSLITGGKCGLPERVKNISRQGIDLTLLDPQEFLDKGRTGIYEVDLVLRADNPNGLQAPSGIYSPDLMPPARDTTPSGS